jgi:hypothetical protein
MVMRKLLLFLAGSAGLALFACLLSAWSSALAGEPSAVAVTLPTAPDFYIQDWSSPAMNEMHPDVAYNPVDDEYLVVFDWDFHGGGDRDVMYVLVHPDGYAGPMPLEVAEDPAFDDAHPAVAYNPDDGNYLVVWERSDATAVPQIFGAIITETAGVPFYIAVGNAPHRSPDVAYSSVAGRYLVVWEDHGVGWIMPPDIRGASYDGTGADLQSIHIAPEPNVGTSLQARPAVTAHATLPRWLVTWEDSRTEVTTGIDIYGQQVAFAASVLSLYGGQVAIGAQAGNAQAPDVAWGAAGPGEGEYLTVWSEGGWVFARRVGADSTLLGGLITVSNYVGSEKLEPAVVYASASNAWWVAWADSRDYG